MEIALYHYIFGFIACFLTMCIVSILRNPVRPGTLWRHALDDPFTYTPVIVKEVKDGWVKYQDGPEDNLRVCSITTFEYTFKRVKNIK